MRICAFCVHITAGLQTSFLRPCITMMGNFMLFVSKVTATITKVLFLDMQTHIQVNPVITCSLACSKDNEPYWSRWQRLDSIDAITRENFPVAAIFGFECNCTCSLPWTTIRSVLIFKLREIASAIFSSLYVVISINSIIGMCYTAYFPLSAWKVTFPLLRSIILNLQKTSCGCFAASM